MANDLALIKKDTVDVVASRIKEFQEKGEIHFPPNYSPENAMKSAWLILQETKDRNGNPALEVCTRDSVANALLDMVVQGLSPAKKQGYFIVYGNNLSFTRSYFGTMAVTKRLNGVEDIFAQVIYEGDDFEFTIQKGTKKIVKHSQKLENIDINKIVGAYCTIIYGDGKEFTEIMTKKQIDQAWSKTKMKSNSVQREFPEEMAKRTVINRTCKLFTNTSDDSDLLIESFNRSTEAEYATDEDIVQEIIAASANSEVIDIEPDQVSPVEPKPETTKQPDKNSESKQVIMEEPGF
jgi:recombination protein RecT